MPSAYVLISLNISVDFADSLEEIRAIDGVERADLVVGPDDCITIVTAEDTTQLMNTIREIRNIQGVDRTDTRSVADM